MTRKSVRTILILSMIFILPAVNTHGEWNSIQKTPLKEIEEAIQTSERTKDNAVLIAKSQNLIEESKLLNREWDSTYFALVSEVQDARTRMQRHTALVTTISQLEESIEQFERNLVSLKEIYLNRLKAIPTAYVLLSEKTDDIELRARKDIDKDLMDLSKRFLSEVFSPVFLTSQTEVKDARLIKDVITATEASRIESFESDPVYHMTEEGRFFVLQKYRVFPEFKKTGTATSKQPTAEPLPTDFSATIVENTQGRDLSRDFTSMPRKSTAISAMVKDVDDFNTAQTKQLIDTNQDYDREYGKIEAKINIAQESLSVARRSLQNEFGKTDRPALEQQITRSEQDLNRHVKSREMIVITVQSELSQRGENLSDLYKKMIRVAYDDLIARASQLKSYKFFVVENHVLKSEEAESYYTNPIPVAYTIPLRRRTYIPEEGGVFRCGILLGLKVRFESQAPASSAVKATDAKPLAKTTSVAPKQLAAVPRKNAPENDLFPLYGVSLGRTTAPELAKMGTVASIDKRTGRPWLYYKINGMKFWYDKKSRLADHIYITKTDPMPKPWEELGFSWSLSYEGWLSLLKERGYKVEVTGKPKVMKHDHLKKSSLSAELIAARRDRIPVEIELDFDFGQSGTSRTSERTLYSLRVRTRSLGKPVNASQLPDATAPAVSAVEPENDLFPLYGVSLGVTTVKQIENQSKPCIGNDQPGRLPCRTIDDVIFYYDQDSGVIETVGLTKYNDMPDPWRAIGFRWELSYNEWTSFLEGLGYHIDVIQKPTVKRFGKRRSLKASITATRRTRLSIMIDFSFMGGDGKRTSSKSTLSMIHVKRNYAY